MSVLIMQSCIAYIPTASLGRSPSLGTFDKVIVSSGGNRGTSSQTGEGVTHCCFPSGGGRSLVPTQSTSRLPGRGGSELRTHTGESRAIFFNLHVGLSRAFSISNLTSSWLDYLHVELSRAFCAFEAAASCETLVGAGTELRTINPI